STRKRGCRPRPSTDPRRLGRSLPTLCRVKAEGEEAHDGDRTRDPGLGKRMPESMVSRDRRPFGDRAGRTRSKPLEKRRVRLPDGPAVADRDVVEECDLVEFAVVEQDVCVGVGCDRERALADAGADQGPGFALAVPEADAAVAEVVR